MKLIIGLGADKEFYKAASLWLVFSLEIEVGQGLVEFNLKLYV